ncbi:MAG: hypothetical protein KatS3mg131_0737 [Candidatus Tectimicrobiota bacterium]|nr:MAG: hypothetical protein KatS3mg131_0737 [Candidatus Tectomicrobia bacterium]
MAAERDVLGRLGKRLRQLRQARGLTQWQVAERGINYKYYQRIERGRINVTVRTLARLAALLEVPLHELFCDTPNAESKDDARLSTQNILSP